MANPRNRTTQTTKTAVPTTPVAPPTPVDTPTIPADVVQPTQTTLVEPPPVLEESTPVIPPKPVDEFKETAPPKDIYEYLQRSFNITGKPSALLIQIIAQLDAYCKSMGPNTPVTPTDGAMHQRNLYNVYLTALGAANGEYVTALSTVLFYFNLHSDGTFSERLTSRFMDTVQLSAADSITFRVLTSTFTATANPSLRSTALSRIDLQRVASGLANESQKEHLLAFFQ